VKKITIWMILGVMTMLALVASVAACAEKPAADESQVRAYADPITEDTLIGMNENDYAKFSEHFDEAMKNAIPEANFGQLVATIKPVIGDYVSKEFWTVEKQGEYTLVKYKTKFTNESADVIVTVSFHEVEGKTYLSGLWFDSPKLRKQ